MIPRIAITPGEPAGVGPELLVRLAQQSWPAELVAVADPSMLLERAKQIGLPLDCREVDFSAPPQAHTPGTLRCLRTSLAAPAQAGKLDAGNAHYVLTTLEMATDACLAGHTQALVTGPVQKSIINDAGIAFSGHTEFLAQRCGVDKVVMMLATDELRVALVTTHLPLRAVADAIDDAELSRTLDILQGALRQDFNCDDPSILVLGLNPHAGEGGHLGREEIDIITPCLERYRQQGWRLQGPLPADTAFTPHHLQHSDAVLAMYHDQGLPVLKYQGFGRAINITLGLPIVRTSVDHGTALDLAGSGQADTGSFEQALHTGIDMARSRHRTQS